MRENGSEYNLHFVHLLERGTKQQEGIEIPQMEKRGQDN